jgi:hypothetical protein
MSEVRLEKWNKEKYYMVEELAVISKGKYMENKWQLKLDTKGS